MQNAEMTSEDFAVRRYAAVELAKHAGALMLQGSADVHEVQQKSSSTDIVTAVDKAAEASIVRAIDRDFDGDGLFAEEGSVRESQTGYTWIIDPLDGTANFVRGLRSSAVSIALAFEDVIRLGVVIDPYANELFVGITDEGATCNGVPLNVSKYDKALKESFVGVSGSNRPEPRKKRSALVASLIEVADSVRDPGSTALSLCWTAAGRFNAHIGMDVEWWDLAAGIVIAREAGCKAVSFDGESDPTPEGFVVAPEGRLNELLVILD
jgi:myo-inositol-1(or 4)-monophosphatase